MGVQVMGVEGAAGKQKNRKKERCKIILIELLLQPPKRKEFSLFSLFVLESSKAREAEARIQVRKQQLLLCYT